MTWEPDKHSKKDVLFSLPSPDNSFCNGKKKNEIKFLRVNVVNVQFHVWAIHILELEIDSQNEFIYFFRIYSAKKMFVFLLATPIF